MQDLEIGKGQTRTREVGKDISELARSIAKVGLLEPIVVCPGSKEGKYEILTGQRRFLACRELGLKTITAAVLSRPVTEMEAKVISVTENLVRRDLNSRDLIDVCTYLYKQYGSHKAVCDETGLPYSKVTQYVKYDALVPELKKRVDDGLDIKVALRAQQAASVSGQTNVNEAIRFADEMKTMSNVNQANVVEIRRENPERPAEAIIAEAKGSAMITQVIVALTKAAHRSLQQYSEDERITQDEAAAALITEGLTLKGYLGEGNV